IENFEKVLIENFGVAEEERRKHVDAIFRKYQSYNLSLSELVYANFNSSFIDAYYYLTSNQSEGIFIKPLKYFDDVEFTNKTLVIDFSSGLLFFELASEMELIFGKFIIAESTYRLIDNLIVETQSQRG